MGNGDGREEALQADYKTGRKKKKKQVTKITHKKAISEALIKLLTKILCMS